MTLLAPLALFGILLLALPIIVHLFKPRKMRQTPFSSLRWLKQTHQRLSRRIQWHQWLLFLLRAGVVVLLVFALAKPLLGLRGDGRPVDRFVVVDTSRSMGYKTEGSAAPLEKAQDLATDLVSNNRPGDRTAVILAGKQPRLVSGPVADALEHVPTVRAAKPALADGNLGSSLPLVRSLVPQEQTDRDIEVVFLTDNLKQRWQPGEIQAFLKDLPGGVKATVVDVGAGSPHNAWIANARMIHLGPDEDHMLRVDIGCVGGQQQRSIRMTGIDGVDDVTLEVNLKPGQLVPVNFTIDKDVKLAGQTAQFRLEGPDALPSDDAFFLNLDSAWSLRILLVEPESLSSDGRKIGLNLVRGIESLKKKKVACTLTTRTSVEATAAEFQNSDVIFLAGVPDLSAAALESLENRVRAGAGLVLFLGPHVKAEFYNQKLHRAGQAAPGLLPLPLKTGPDLLLQPGNPGILTNIRWKHQLLAPLYDPVLNDATQARFQFYCLLQGTLGNDDQVLARFDDETPAIIERPFGAGRVLVFNTTPNPEWSDLPLKKIFVPLLDRVLSYLSAGGVREGFTVGDNVVLPLPQLETDELVVVLAPSGVKLTPRQVEARGRTFLHLDEVSEAGVYQVLRSGKSGKNLAFVVNAGRGDSPLGPMDASVLEQWWAPASFETLGAEAAAARFAAQSSHWSLWPALVLIAGLLLVAETIYVYRLCPRVNPKVAESVVPQGSIMKPLGEKASV